MAFIQQAPVDFHKIGRARLGCTRENIGGFQFFPKLFVCKINPIPETLFSEKNIKRYPLNLVLLNEFGSKVRSGVGQNFDHKYTLPVHFLLFSEYSFYFSFEYFHIRRFSGFSCPTMAEKSNRPVFRPVSLVRTRRSEEHTSELQSRPHLVCRLLLEKKN